MVLCICFSSSNWNGIKEQEGGAALLLRELKSLPFFGGLFLLLLLLLFCFLEALKNKAP